MVGDSACATSGFGASGGSAEASASGTSGPAGGVTVLASAGMADVLSITPSSASGSFEADSSTISSCLSPEDTSGVGASGSSTIGVLRTKSCLYLSFISTPCLSHIFLYSSSSLPRQTSSIFSTSFWGLISA